MAKKWIQKTHMQKGALHRALHVPEGQKIPAAKMAKARRSENPRIRREAALARTLGKMHHADGGAVIQGEGEAPKHGAHKKRRE